MLWHDAMGHANNGFLSPSGKWRIQHHTMPNKKTIDGGGQRARQGSTILRAFSFPDNIKDHSTNFNQNFLFLKKIWIN